MCASIHLHFTLGHCVRFFSSIRSFCICLTGAQLTRLWMRAPHITQLDRDVYIFPYYAPYNAFAYLLTQHNLFVYEQNGESAEPQETGLMFYFGCVCMRVCDCWRYNYRIFRTCVILTLAFPFGHFVYVFFFLFRHKQVQRTHSS